METLTLLNDPIDRERLDEAQRSVDAGDVTTGEDIGPAHRRTSSARHRRRVRYGVELARPARRALTDELPAKVAAVAWELIDGALHDNPQRLGKPLRAPYAGHWVARRSSYRVRCRIDEDRHMVIVLDMRARADAYRA